MSNDVVDPEQAMRETVQAFASRLVIESPNSKMHERGNEETPLPAGSPMPRLEAAGWLNDEHSTGNASDKVVVVDVWDGGCPYCSMTVPTLKKIYDEYRDQVAFVGMTSADRDDAKIYVESLDVAWPSGYDAGPTIDKLGANAPTVFVVVDGQVVWNDNKARYRHDVSGYRERLKRAIQQALTLRSGSRAGSLGAG